MSSTEIDVQQIERNIKESQRLVDLGDALARLKSNRDFLKVIQKGYFEDEAVRLVHLKSDSNLQSGDSQRSILSQMDSIGNLAQYFHTVAYKAEMARKAIAYDTEVRDELLAGELE
jgi:hypothetical protein